MFDAVATRLTGLRTRYAEPHRAYHTQAHVDAMLAGWRDLGDVIVHPAAVELAIWYHDAIYKSEATDNEARSAALLRAELTGLADPALLDLAELLVRATADHALPAALPAAFKADAALFLDLDMAVLGVDRAAFAAYERGIAAEFVPVHGLLPFRSGRTRFLRTMLERPRLFLSERFHLHCDVSPPAATCGRHWPGWSRIHVKHGMPATGSSVQTMNLKSSRWASRPRAPSSAEPERYRTACSVGTSCSERNLSGASTPVMAGCRIASTCKLRDEKKDDRSSTTTVRRET